MGAILTRLSVMCGQRLLRGGECTPSHTKREALNTGSPFQTTKSQKIIKDHIHAIKKKLKKKCRDDHCSKKETREMGSIFVLYIEPTIPTYVLTD